MSSPIESLSSIRDFLRSHALGRIFLAFMLISLVVSWINFSPDGLLGKADFVGYAVCHRIQTRSFLIGDIQFSVCARCTGQYLGAVVGTLFLGLFRRYRSSRPPGIIIGVLLIWGIAYAVDGFNSFLHLIPGTEEFWLYQPSNTIRLITGIGVGLGISIMLFQTFNQTMWRQTDRRPVLNGLKDFGTLVLISTVLVVLVIGGNPIILYPLSLISAGGVLMLLTMVYSMVWVMIFRSEGSIENNRQLALPITAGLCTALLQILTIALIRYLVTGTWGEFIIG